MRSLALLLAISLPLTAAADESELDKELASTRERLASCAIVLDEILGAPDASVPQSLLERAACVIVIPGMKKGGLGIGGRFGRGAVSCRRDPVDRGGSRSGQPVDAVTSSVWGPPVMLSLGGLSVGFQIGGASIDVVMLVMNRGGMHKLLKNEVELGADASVAAGPVGRAGSAGTDLTFEAQILTYSRSKGLFAGIELKGAMLRPHSDANDALYGSAADVELLLFDRAAVVPNAGLKLVDLLGKRAP